jgi:hypothetical protein
MLPKDDQREQRHMQHEYHFDGFAQSQNGQDKHKLEPKRPRYRGSYESMSLNDEVMSREPSLIVVECSAAVTVQ